MPFVRDLVYGLRLLRRNPGFYLLGVAILSLGIGATTAIFSLIDGVLLNPLPYRDADRLAVIWSDFSRLRGNARALTAPALYFDWRERSHSFAEMAAFVNGNRTFTAFDQPVTPFTHEVTPNYFEVAGVRAFRGRTFLADEGLPGKDNVAVISDSLWRSVFGGSESTVGASVELDGRSVRIVGILPGAYRPPNNGITRQPELFVPASFDKQRMERLSRSMVVIGRLKGGVSMAQARAEIAAITTRIVSETPDGATPPTAQVNAIRDDMTGEYRRPFFLLQAAVGIMLLIACANVANLLLARYSARGYEFSVRAAIGASRGQIVRQLLAENLVLSGMGAIGGVLFATWSVRPMLALVPAAAGLPFADQVHVSPLALGVALALSLLSSIAFGLAPARTVSRAGATLVESSRSRTAGPSSALWRNVLIAGEIGLSLILLASAGLLVQTFVHLSRESWGFEPANVLTLRNSLRGEAYRTESAQRNYFDAAVRKLREIPGVESVSAVNFPPPIGPYAPARFVPAGHAAGPGRDPAATVLTVLPDYFETLRTPILSGRSISASDTADSAPVVVISQSVAKRDFPNGDPVGQSLRFTGADRRDWRIVGVAQDIRGQGLNREAPDVLYLPFAQKTERPTMSFVIRTRVAPRSIATTAERSLWSLGKLMNVYAVGPLEEALSDSYWQSRFTMSLLAIFAGLALLLAAAGVYGVMSYLAVQRTQEIGIRIAIGASPSDVVWLVTNQGLRAAVAGLVAGITGYLAISRLLAGQLFGVSAVDPLTLLAAALGLMFICLAASAVPAFRAARVDPLRALRHGG